MSTGILNAFHNLPMICKVYFYIARSVKGQDGFPESHITNTLLTKLVWSRWLDIGLVMFFCEFMNVDSVSVHKHAKKEQSLTNTQPC